VVRLKGGDPFVLGRGSEEALALAAAGVPFELVPGLSSATAGPLLAGIPLTHRGVADAFCVVSAHPRELDASFTLPRWRARLTVVVLMGVRTAPRWTAALLAGGWPAETPMAWVMWAARAEQRSARATLGRAVEAATAHGIDAPAVAVVGGVAGLPPLEVAPARAG
jgi:uroporphyrin-III C-methyltransferase